MNQPNTYWYCTSPARGVLYLPSSLLTGMVLTFKLQKNFVNLTQN